MIISGGVNIYSAEIEGALISHEGIRDCAVFGVPDPEFGERVHAAIELANGAELDVQAIRAFLCGRLARFKIPKELTFHDRLPRYDNGKIYKQALRAPYWRDYGRKI